MKFIKLFFFFFPKEKDLNWYLKNERLIANFVGFMAVISMAILVLYISIPFTIGTEIKGVKIQDIGSYLSGITSTGVFVWLIIGYLNQSANNNRQALETKINLELTRESLELTRAMYQEERLGVFSANQPNFIQAFGHKYEHENQTCIAFSFKNIGSTSTDIYIKNSQGYCCSEVVQILEKGESVKIKTEFAYYLDVEDQGKIPMFKKCWIHYRDNIGVSRHASVELYWFSVPVYGKRIPKILIDMPESPEQSIPTFDMEVGGVD
ncbi:hypothetical protein ACFQ45_13075 [Rhodanobacter aciditrophus]|uniref:Uncharacterized protein n=1 Tax=Rhodanobacter aciditrophus TaxID=1623218 RepID=A0ABW4B458_9GAMM